MFMFHGLHKCEHTSTLQFVSISDDFTRIGCLNVEDLKTYDIIYGSLTHTARKIDPKAMPVLQKNPLMLPKIIQSILKVESTVFTEIEQHPMCQELQKRKNLADPPRLTNFIDLRQMHLIRNINVPKDQLDDFLVRSKNIATCLTDDLKAECIGLRRYWSLTKYQTEDCLGFADASGKVFVHVSMVDARIHYECVTRELYRMVPHNSQCPHAMIDYGVSVCLVSNTWDGVPFHQWASPPTETLLFLKQVQDVRMNPPTSRQAWENHWINLALVPMEWK
jgi:hypothetical protein